MTASGQRPWKRVSGVPSPGKGDRKNLNPKHNSRQTSLFLHQFCNGNRTRQIAEDMDVIGHSIDNKSRTIDLLQNGGHVGIQIRFDFFLDKWITFLGAEYDVE
jgi:hypothetical protein